MKRILLFLLLFFVLCSMVYAQAGDRPKLVFSPVINFDQIFVMLRQILIQMFFQYYHLVLGFIAVMLLISYFQGMLEGRQMRAERERREQEYRRDYRERSEIRRDEKRRDLIRKYVDDKAADRVLHDIRGDNWKQSLRLSKTKPENDDLRLAPLDDDDVYSNGMSLYAGQVESQEYDVGLYGDRESWEYGGRAITFWRADGTEESGKLFYGSLESGKDKDGKYKKEYNFRRRYYNRYHGTSDWDEDYGGY